jgi:hypothetical protein
MQFIQSNIGNIIVGAVVFAALAFALIRLINTFRKGKAGCGCGCDGSGSRPAKRAGFRK